MKEQVKEQGCTLPDGVTAEEFEALKERYGAGKIKIAMLPKDEDGNEFMVIGVRVPDRKCLGEFEKWVDKDPNRAKEILVNACVLSCKETVKAEDELFLGAFDAITKLIPVRVAIIKDLDGILPEGISEADIKALVERYGERKVKIASLPKDDDGNEFMDVIVRVPDRKCLGEFEKWADKSPDKAKEILVNACVLSKKEVVKADDGLFFGAFDAVTKLIPVRTAIVKNC